MPFHDGSLLIRIGLCLGGGAAAAFGFALRFTASRAAWGFGLFRLGGMWSVEACRCRRLWGFWGGVWVPYAF